MNTLAHGYQPIADSYPEMVTPEGALRPHWGDMMAQFEAYGAQNIDARWKRARRVIRENGVTYNVYGDLNDHTRPWELDPVPLMISADEWEVVSDGLIQRMEVLNRTLADLYGNQTLLHQNILPSELVHANPSFLRPCARIVPTDNQYLTLMAVDLARMPGGQWRVVKDRTQSPSGAGYALENRLVVSRTFPTMYRDGGIERLASFFAALRDRLARLSPRRSDSPRVVILTPGPDSESYFEQAYLARYLGYPLVQGNDLTARGNQIFLKTLAGLRLVDVILRRQPDSDCDPLELDGASMLGVPGLLQAAAAGEVAIANALGSGLAETPALLPFFPGLCKHFLGEEQKLWTVPTLWCGQKKERDQVLGNLDRWVLKSAFSEGDDTPVFARQLSVEDRARLTEKIQARPERFIAQENAAFSSVPCWMDGKLSPRYAMLRAFVVSTRDGWKVMPGGLVRTSPDPDSTVVSIERGGGSKDAWVQSRGAVSKITLLPREGNETVLSRGEENISSRVADNMFWLGRYIQRAEYQTRLLRTTLRRLTEETMPDGTPEAAELLRTLSSITDQVPKDGPILDPVREMERTALFIHSIIFDPNHAGNLHHALSQACRIGYMARDRVSVDTWRVLDRLNQELRDTPSAADLTDILDLLDQLLIPLSAFSGLAAESMTHGFGWRFMDMGFRLERTVMSAHILRDLLIKPDPYETPVLDAVLEVASSSITYRTRYQSHVALLPLLDLLIADTSNPRSIAYQLELIRVHIRELSSLPRNGQLPEQILSTELVHYVEEFDLRQVLARNPAGEREKLDGFLRAITDKVQELSTLITERYLAHIETSRQFSSLLSGEIKIPESIR